MTTNNDDSPAFDFSNMGETKTGESLVLNLRP